MARFRIRFCLTLLLMLPGSAFAAFEWRDVAQQVSIRADGSVHVSDERTLWTDEDFGEAFICINLAPGQTLTLLPDSGALGPGPSARAYTQACEDGSGGTELVIENSSRVQQRRVHFSYRLDNTLDYYFDVVQWYWQLLDTDSPPVRGYRLTVEAPGAMEQPYDAIVYRFGNPQLPQVSLSDDRSTLKVSFRTVPAGYGVEVRYLMDPRLFTRKSEVPGLEQLLRDITTLENINVPGSPAVVLDSSPATLPNRTDTVTLSGSTSGTRVTQVRVGLNGGPSAQCEGTAQFTCTVSNLPVQHNRLQVIALDEAGRAGVADAGVTRLSMLDTLRSDPWLGLAGLALLVWAFLSLLQAKRTFHDPKLDTMLYPFEPPSDLPPAAVPALLTKHFQASAMNPAFHATIMDLARRGYGVFTGRKNRFSMDVNVTKSTDGLLDFEIDVLDFLRQAALTGQAGPVGGFLQQMLGRPAPAVEGDLVPLDETALKKYARTRTGFVEKWATKVRSWVTARFGGRLLTADSVRASHRWLVITALLLVGQVIFAALTLGPARISFTSLAVLTLPLFGLAVSLQSWKPDVAAEVYGWQGFRRTLTDYTRMKDAPDDFFILWDRYFVYAAALGVARQYLKNLERAAPLRGIDETAMVSRAAWIGSYSALGSISSLSEFSGAVSDMSRSLSSSLSSAGVSASSGGSSSGGGGGGGGGSSGGR
jgi:uncharacterized membrane protein YgcG